MFDPQGLQTVVEGLQARLGEGLVKAAVNGLELDLQVAPDSLLELMAALHEGILAAQHSFTDTCGVEREESIETIYRFALVSEPVRVVVRVQTPKTKAILPSLTHLYKGALWAERELAEMFGVTFTDHLDPRHLLLPEDWVGFPMRKDYRYPLEHPYLTPDPLRDNPGAVLAPTEKPAKTPDHTGDA